MTRMTPRRLTTLQCSQIGLTLLRTFTNAPAHFGLETDSKPTWGQYFTQANPSQNAYGTTRTSAATYAAPVRCRPTYTVWALRTSVPRTRNTRWIST